MCRSSTSRSSNSSERYRCTDCQAPRKHSLGCLPYPSSLRKPGPTGTPEMVGAWNESCGASTRPPLQFIRHYVPAHTATIPVVLVESPVEDEAPVPTEAVAPLPPTPSPVGLAQLIIAKRTRHGSHARFARWVRRIATGSLALSLRCMVGQQTRSQYVGPRL